MRSFHHNCGRLLKCDECIYWDLRETLIASMPPWYQKAMKTADTYGMGEKKLARILGEEPARNLAAAYRPVGVP